MITGRKHGLHAETATTAEAIRGAFLTSQEELRSLAAFLTGDDRVGEACVLDACEFMQRSCDAGTDWLTVSPAFATLNSAIQIQQLRIAELAPVYENRRCSGRTDEQLPAESLAFIVLESSAIRSRLDTICCFVLVICGIEKRTSTEAAKWLGISRWAVEAAYCTAIESLAIIDWQRLIESDPDSTAWN